MTDRHLAAVLVLDPAAFSPPVSPERALWAAALYRAICDFLGINLKTAKGYGPLITRNAEAWFRAEGYAPGSFRWVCDALNLDTRTVHRWVLETPRAKSRRFFSDR